MRKPLEIPIPTAEELTSLETLYRTTRVVRLRTRVQIVLLAGEQRMTAPSIARIVREDDQTVRNWLKRVAYHWLRVELVRPDFKLNMHHKKLHP